MGVWKARGGLHLSLELFGVAMSPRATGDRPR